MGVAGLLVAGTVLAACSGPSQAGSAAIVGDTAISVDTLQATVDGVLDREPAARAAQRARKLDVISRQVLTLRVRHELVSRLAHREHLRADHSAVDALLAESGGARNAARGTVLDPAGMTRYTTDTVLLAEFARRRLPGLSVTFDYALVPGPRAANRLARGIAADPDHASDAITGVARSGAAGGLGKRVVARRQLSTAALSPLFGIPEGTVAAYPVGGSSARWLVVLVHDRQMGTGGPGRAAFHGGGSRIELLGKLGLHLLGARSSATDIRINPRYGAWDPLALRVAASDEVTTGVAIPLGSGSSRQ